jgi:hypothetical protein
MYQIELSFKVTYDFELMRQLDGEINRLIGPDYSTVCKEGYRDYKFGNLTLERALHIEHIAKTLSMQFLVCVNIHRCEEG